MDASRISRIAALLAEPTRAEMLMVMMDGRAHPASDLAAFAHVSQSTASHHLASLTDGGIVTVIQSGRHRYHRLANSQIAELLESIGGLCAAPVQIKSNELSECRVCYDHLAGRLGVELRKSLENKTYLVEEDGHFQVTSTGQCFFADLGIEVAELQRKRRPVTRACLDWTERVNHLGGSLGAAILIRLLERRWVERVDGSRKVIVTPIGAKCLHELLGI
jgi:DNA-binding transcriptional ArsR family regulator